MILEIKLFALSIIYNFDIVLPSSSKKIYRNIIPPLKLENGKNNFENKI